jgi:hypothetical protein
VSELWANYWRFIVVGLVVGQFFFYAARKPTQQLIRSVGAALRAPFRLAASWCRRIASELSRRNRELVLEAAKHETEKKLERELVRLETGMARELKTYPTLHRRLSDAVLEIEKDLSRTADAPPSIEGWPEALKAVSEMPTLADSHSRTVLEAMKQAAAKSEERALKTYRSATAKRHQILNAMQPRIREVKATSSDLLSAVERAIETSSRVDQYMERHEKLKKKDGASPLSPTSRRSMQPHRASSFACSAKRHWGGRSLLRSYRTPRTLRAFPAFVISSAGSLTLDSRQRRSAQHSSAMAKSWCS